MNKAVVLMNLGTPAAPTAAAIRRYLRDFLGDPRVVEIPRALWLPILHGPILMLRPRKLAPAYRDIWQRYGDSPLRVISQRQVAALQRRLDGTGIDAVVRLAMTYGGPDLDTVIDELRAQGVERFLVLPLYPQFSATTTGAIYDQVAALYRGNRNVPDVRVVKSYSDHPLYIDALAQSVRRHWAVNGRGERLLLSFHGIPRRNVERGDPYQRECEATAQALAEALQLAPDQWQLSFQSRFGRAEWLQPYTSALLEQWGRAGVGAIDVICPAFAADCLETLEEIAVENRHLYQRAGGGELRYIPCLNDSDEHIALLASIVARDL